MSAGRHRAAVDGHEVGLGRLAPNLAAILAYAHEMMFRSRAGTDSEHTAAG